MARKRMRKQRKAAGRDVQRRLKAYSKAATAVLALGGGAALSLPDSSEAAVIYTELNPDVTLAAPFYSFGSLTITTTPAITSVTNLIDKIAYHPIDFDHDGNPELIFAHARAGANIEMTTTNTFSLKVNLAGAGVLAVSHAEVSMEGSLALRAFNASSQISNVAGRTLYNSYGGGILGAAIRLSGSLPPPWQTLIFAYFDETGSSISTQLGEFLGKGPKAIGVKFTVGACVHYGWVRVEAPKNAEYLKVLDYAYETECGKPIHVDAPAVGGMVHDVSDAPIVEVQQ